MKFKNCVVGTKVVIKDGGEGFYHEYEGHEGVIVAVDEYSELDVKVEFDDGKTDWGNHKGIRKLKEQEGDTAS